MNKGYTYDQKVIRTKDVTDEEYAYIAENNKSLDGFNTRLDWERSYPYGDVFRTILELYQIMVYLVKKKSLLFKKRIFT